GAAARSCSRIEARRAPNAVASFGPRLRAQGTFPLHVSSSTGSQSFPYRVTVIGLTSFGCARRNVNAAFSCDPRNLSCNGVRSEKAGQPPRENVTVDSPGQP